MTIQEIPKHPRALAILVGFLLIVIGLGSGSIPIQWFGGIIILLGALPTSVIEKIVDELRRA